MDDRGFIFFLCGVVILLGCIVIFLLVRLYALSRLLELSCVGLSAADLKISLTKRFNLLKGLYQLIYFVCDNFPRHSGKIARFVEREYSNGSLSSLCSDIIHATDMCEGGAITKMAVKYKLTQLETRTCCFLYWGFKWQHASIIENITENAYNVRCYRIRKKLNIAKGESISSFVLDFCSSNSSVQ